MSDFRVNPNQAKDLSRIGSSLKEMAFLKESISVEAHNIIVDHAPVKGINPMGWVTLIVYKGDNETVDVIVPQDRITYILWIKELPEGFN